jgi:hypothetical protein
VAVERFNRLAGRDGQPAPGDPAWLEFRRDQVTALVRKVYLNTWAARPGCRVSAATITFASPPADAGAAAFANTDAYARVLQDWRGWMREGIIDLNIPMNYRDQASLGGDFLTWTRRVADMQFGRQAAVGVGSFLNTTAATIAQFRATRDPGPTGKAPAGAVGYSYAVPNDDGVSRTQFLDALTSPSAFDPVTPPLFESASPTPEMPWKSDTSLGHLMGTVRDEATDGPLDGASVVVAREGVEVRALTTDATGFYGAVGLPVGTYTLTVTAEGLPERHVSLGIEGARVTPADLELGDTDPFVITALGYDDVAGGWALTWASQPGRSYAVQVSADAAAWRDLATGVPSGGLITTYRDFTAALDVHRFYRVAEE